MTSRLSSFVVSGVAAGAVASIFACGSAADRSYCDDTGCYQCDAYGCSPITGNGATPTSTSTGTAATDSGTTTPPPVGDAATGTDAGTGTSVSTVCKYSSECGDGKICDDGRCLPSCATAACPADSTCVKGACEPNAPAADDGGAGPQTCTVDAECGDGNYCTPQGVCGLDTRPKPNCVSDDTCGGSVATPKKCLAGYCKFTCTSDAYCRTIDSRIGFCAPDGVCRTEAEADAQCTDSTQCTAPATCVDNACK